ncbi:hypothetical protein SGPA1_60193 [Streptomyces misionensis JCM 4497]
MGAVPEFTSCFSFGFEGPTAAVNRPPWPGATIKPLNREDDIYVRRNSVSDPLALVRGRTALGEPPRRSRGRLRPGDRPRHLRVRRGRPQRGTR